MDQRAVLDVLALGPGPTDGRGYGLYLTHHLCDLVRLHSTRDGGTTVRMTMYLDGPHR